MAGSVQAGPMMHPGDVEQELFDLPGLRIAKVFLHLNAPLLHGIV